MYNRLKNTLFADLIFLFWNKFRGVHSGLEVRNYNKQSELINTVDLRIHNHLKFMSQINY